MKHLILLSVGLACVSTGQAQPTFERLYLSGPSYTFDLLELPGGNILTCMGEMHLLNAEGYTEQLNSYFGGGIYLPQTLKAAETDTFYFTTATISAQCTFGNSSFYLPVLGKMDSIGRTSAVRRYEMNSGYCNGLPGGLEVTNDLGAITWGREKSFFALRVNETLEPRWGKRVSRGGGFQFIKELPGGDLLAGINMDTAGVVVARLDPDGNFLWSKSYIRPRGIVQDALVESDDSFILVGYTDSTGSTNPFIPEPPTFQPKLFMMKLSGDGAVQWCRGWQSPTNLWYTRKYCTIERTPDGRIIVLSTLAYPENHLWYRPFLMKTDQSGDTLWTRSMGRDDYRYKTQNLTVAADGGILMSGIIYGDMPGGNSSLEYIYKVDSLGHFPCWERFHPVQTMDLFPVDSSFTLIAEDVPVIATPVLVTDSVLDSGPYTIYDGCTFTTGMPTRPSRSRAMSIRPNPNTGRFTVEFQDPLMAESYYSVYDALGKLLLQRAAAHGQRTQEVDLGRYGSGTYVIKFTDAEGTCYEQVVVE